MTVRTTVDEDETENDETSETEVAWDARDHWLDARPGHGAHTRTEDWVCANARQQQNDGRSNTNTTFYGGDAETRGPGQKHRDPEDRKSWSDLAKVNDGMYSKLTSREGENFKADKRRWIETFGSHIGASQYQREETLNVIEQIEPGPYKAAHIPIECLILAVMSFFTDSDIEVHADEDPETAMERRLIEREETHTLLEDLELDRSDVIQTRKLLRKNDSDLVLPDQNA